jgi:hypothetical protein
VRNEVDKTEFLSLVQTERANLIALLSRVDESDYFTPGVASHWTLKDVIAHITWYEREMIGVVSTRTLSGSEWWDLPLDARNAAIYELNRDKSLAVVLDEYKRVYDAFLACVQDLRDEDSLNANRFSGIPDGWVP